MRLHSSRARHGDRVINQEGESLEDSGRFPVLAFVLGRRSDEGPVAPAPASVRRPVAALPSAEPRLGLPLPTAPRPRVPQRRAPEWRGPVGVSPTAQLAAVAQEAHGRLTQLGERVGLVAQGHHMAIRVWSDSLRRAIGAPVRITGPESHRAVLAAAALEGGESAAAGVELVRGEILRRALAAAPVLAGTEAER